MATISLAQRRSWLCNRCGATQDPVTWLVIDAIERPDLRVALASGALVRRQCNQCGAEVRRSAPLIVVRLATCVPVTAGLGEADLGRQDPLSPADDLIDRTRAALGESLRDVPGPVVLARFEALEIAAKRDVDVDLEEVRAVASAAPRDDDPYGHFLRVILNTEPERRAQLAGYRLRNATSPGDLSLLLEELPEVKSPAVREDFITWSEQAANAEERAVALAYARVAESMARGDADAAWSNYQQEMGAVWREHVQPRLHQLRQELEAAEATQDHTRVTIVGGEIIGIARDAGIRELEIAVSLTVADALRQLPGDRGDHAERALELYERGLALLDADTSVGSTERRTQFLIDLGATYGSRRRGDPAANADTSIEYLRRAVGQTSVNEDGATWAIAHTNLALGLLNRHRDENDVDEAIEHLNASLEWRSYERDPLDWAYTQVNLGLAFDRRGAGSRAENLRTAIHHGEMARDGAAAADNREVGATAEHNLSSDKWALAILEETEPAEADRLLAEAEEHARASLKLRQDEPSVDLGRIWSHLASILGRRGDSAAAADAYRHALDHLTPDAAPAPCRHAAASLASLMEERDEWNVAADAWDIAAQAAAVAFETRVSVEGRFEEARADVTLFRFAAYALARTGRVVRAVEVIELGRARELTALAMADLVDVKMLGNLDPAMCQRFLEERARLDRIDGRTPEGSEATMADRGRAADAFRRTVRQVRQLPGFEGLFHRPTLDDVAVAARPNAPIAYPINAPGGSGTLIVWGSVTDPDRRVSFVHSANLSSRELAQQLLGVGASGQPIASYIRAQSQDALRLDEAIADLGKTLGQHLLAPLSRRLVSSGAHGVCIVPTGLVGLLPLHAIAWTDGSGSRCLLDDLEITYAPSAALRAACQRRAEERAGHRIKLLAVGDPEQDGPRNLPGAEVEVGLVTDIVRDEDAIVLTGVQASKSSVTRALPMATLVHLACHGHTGFLDEPLTAAIYLAGGEKLSAQGILELDRLEARLVVASACETAIVQGYDTLEEVLGLSSVLLASGAAGVIASLWSVDDDATAILMSRFYEFLIRDNIEPAAALRAAQLWLRDSTGQEIDTYIDARPKLRTYRATAQNRTRGIDVHSAVRPYAASSLWAAFALSGA